MNYFWSNTIWYIAVGFITVLELMYIIKKADNRKIVICLYFSVLGLTFAIETILFNFLKAYQYYPLVIRTSSFDDGLLGNIVSQTSISATALLIAVLNLSVKQWFVFPAIYSLVETFFLYLGIYKQNWYRTWFTCLGLLIFFPAIKILYKKLFKPYGLVFRYLIIMNSVFAVYICLVNWPFRLTGTANFNNFLLDDPVSSYTLAAVLKSSIESNVLIALYLLKCNFKITLSAISLLHILNFFLHKFDILQVSKGWLWPYTTISIFSTYILILIFGKLLDRNQS